MLSDVLREAELRRLFQSSAVLFPLAATFLAIAIIVCQAPFSIALSTVSSDASLLDIRVLIGERMASRTVRFGSILSGKPNTAKDVNSKCNSFQMGGVDASTVTTQMVDRESTRDRSNQCLVSKTVCHAMFAIKPESTIAKIEISTGPRPATVAAKRDFFAEAYWKPQKVHLATFAPRQEAHGHLNNSCLGETQFVRQMRNELQTPGTEPETGGIFHRRKVATIALQVKPSKLEV